MDHSPIQECYGRVVVNVLEEVRVICGIWVIWFRGKEGLMWEFFFFFGYSFYLFLLFRFFIQLLIFLNIILLTMSFLMCQLNLLFVMCQWVNDKNEIDCKTITKVLLKLQTCSALSFPNKFKRRILWNNIIQIILFSLKWIKFN